MRWVAVAALLAVAAGGCGGDDSGSLVVSAASSLQGPLTACTEGSDAKVQFGGSDELAAQIRKGVEPGVYAAANTKLPRQLADEGLLSDATIFATNELVVAVREGAAVDDLDDLARGGIRLAIGSEGVPIGDYTREVLAKLGPTRSQAILANVRTEEPDVKGIVGKLSQGAADAGFVYVTDAKAARLTSIAIPDELRPQVAYAAGIVDKSEAASEFLDGLTAGACADALREAGFGAPPE